MAAAALLLHLSKTATPEQGRGPPSVWQWRCCSAETPATLIHHIHIWHPLSCCRVRLPVNPESGRGVVLGEGKPENQNHAIIFCFNETLQAIDMNQVLPPALPAPQPAKGTHLSA